MLRSPWKVSRKQWLSQWGSVLAGNVGGQAWGETRGKKRQQTPRDLVALVTLCIPALPEHFPWDSPCCHKGAPSHLSSTWGRGSLLIPQMRPQPEGWAPGSARLQWRMWRAMQGKMNTSQMKWMWGSGSSFKEIWTEVDPEERKTRRQTWRWVERMN